MFHKILIPLDGSSLAESALPYAVQLAETFHATLVLLRVVPPMSVPVMEYSMSSTELVPALREAQLTEAALYLQDMKEQPEITALHPLTIWEEGDVAEVILRTVTETGADTVVMATHGRGGLSRWVLGSIADRVVRNASVPVLLVRAGITPDELLVLAEAALV